MNALLAHLKLLGRHHTTVWTGGYAWYYCAHRSHTLGLRCWRWMVYDSFCPRHNSTCYTDCT